MRYVALLVDNRFSRSDVDRLVLSNKDSFYVCVASLERSVRTITFSFQRQPLAGFVFFPSVFVWALLMVPTVFDLCGFGFHALQYRIHYQVGAKDKDGVSESGKGGGPQSLKQVVVAPGVLSLENHCGWSLWFCLEWNGMVFCVVLFGRVHQRGVGNKRAFRENVRGL